MAEDTTQHFSMVANFDARCQIENCPYCVVFMPHNATSGMVRRRCEEITQATRMQMQTAALSYAHQVHALRRIMSTEDPTSRLDVVHFLGDMFDATFANQYADYMQPTGNYGPVRGRSVSASSPATAGRTATVGQNASGSEGTTTPLKNMEEEEYPRWEFVAGKDKRSKWTAYDREANRLLEEAFLMKEKHLSLEIDQWEYEIDLVNLTQLSRTTGTYRNVRRLTGPPSA